MIYFPVEELVHALSLQHAILGEFTHITLIHIHVQHFTFFRMATFKATGELVAISVTQDALPLNLSIIELTLVTVAIAILHLRIVGEKLRFRIKFSMELIAVGKLKNTEVLLVGKHLSDKLSMRKVVGESSRTLHLVCFPNTFVVVIFVILFIPHRYLPRATLSVL